MTQTRVDRTKLLIGTYCLQPYARSEEHVRQLADAGIDFLCATPADRALLDLCQAYGIRRGCVFYMSVLSQNCIYYIPAQKTFEHSFFRFLAANTFRK